MVDLVKEWNCSRGPPPPSHWLLDLPETGTFSDQIPKPDDLSNKLPPWHNPGQGGVGLLMVNTTVKGIRPEQLDGPTPYVAFAAGVIVRGERRYDAPSATPTRSDVPDNTNPRFRGEGPQQPRLMASLVSG